MAGVDYHAIVHFHPEKSHVAQEKSQQDLQNMLILSGSYNLRWSPFNPESLTIVDSRDRVVT